MRSLVILCACVTLAALTGCCGRTSSASRPEPEGNPWVSLSSQLAAAEGTVDLKMRDEFLPDWLRMLPIPETIRSSTKR